MKTKLLLSLILITTVTLFMTLCYAQDQGQGGDRHQGYQGNDQGNDQGNQNWSQYYRGHGDFKHHGDRAYTYQGPYGEYGDVFVFTGRDGKEYDLYVPHQRRPGWGFRGVPLAEGESYDFGLSQTKMYPRPDEVKLGVRLNFRWGSLSLKNNRYYTMYTSPNLINIRGQLYIKGRGRY